MVPSYSGRNYSYFVSIVGQIFYKSHIRCHLFMACNCIILNNLENWILQE